MGTSCLNLRGDSGRSGTSYDQAGHGMGATVLEIHHSLSTRAKSQRGLERPQLRSRPLALK